MELEKFAFHFEPETGWMNDPNGLIFFRGQLHAFFQHNPHAAHWGPMHWGHAVTRDFLHWEELPIALYPDAPYEDFGGCFSGSAVEKDGRLFLLYTSVSKALGQTQSLAVSEDGVHFEKYPGNPVISQSPLDPQSRNFRDPKVFPYGDGYRMVCGAGTESASAVLLFASSDLIHWEYQGPLLDTRAYSEVPECPDLFPLGDKWVLMFSRMDAGRRVQFVLGDFDGLRFTPERFEVPALGPDFYAPQTLLHPSGRRLLLGWFYSWERKVPEGALRAGALTVPLELRLDNDRLTLFPAAEVRPLLRESDPSIRRENGELHITDGSATLLSLPEKDVSRVHVLADGAGREVFLNDGALSVFYRFTPSAS